MSIRTCIAALPGAMGSSTCGLMDVLGTANALADEPVFDLEVRTPQPGGVKTSFGLTLSAKKGLPRRQQHLVLVPGFGVNARHRPLEQILAGLADQARTLGWLRRQYEGGAVVAASCVGTFALAEAGLLDGRHATTSWWIADVFRARYPKVRLDPATLLSHEDGVVTAGAAMAHLDLALYFVSRHGGSSLSRLVAKTLVLDEGRRSQVAYAIPEFTRAQDEVVRRAATLLEANLSEAPAMAELAQRVGVTPRTLNRRFKLALDCTPLEYRTRVRIDRARQLLEGRRRSVEEVAQAVGYGDPSAFYRAFTREVGMAPSDYQHRFGVLPRR